MQALEPPHIPQRPALPCLGPRRRAPLTQVPADSMVSLPNLFIRLISLLCGANRTVNYSQQNKILIVHNYFGLLGDEIIWPQNQGREEEKSTECCKKKKSRREGGARRCFAVACQSCLPRLHEGAPTSRGDTCQHRPCTSLHGSAGSHPATCRLRSCSQSFTKASAAYTCCKCARLREQRLVCRSC